LKVAGVREGHIVYSVNETRVSTNGIELNVLDEGEGPLVVLCHGFPELAFSWRRQIPALVQAGYRVLAPDMRGYGASSAPAAIEDYDILSLCEDMCGLLDAVGEPSAVFVGHDWGATVVWQMAVLHPERVRAVAGLSVPFTPRAPAHPLPILRRHLGEDFYIVRFQEPGVAEVTLSRDVRRTFLRMFGPPAPLDLEGRMSQGTTERPEWISEDELAVYVEMFTRTGFTGGLNWYRNIDRNWELTETVGERRVEQPSLFLTGEVDVVRQFMPVQMMDGWLTDMRANVVVADAGHWVQQEQPQAVNAALVSFLGEVGA
jgi:pimeloyl-ACP methyl ester carboxylesterase